MADINRLLNDHDWRQQVIDFELQNLVAPNTDIYDEPVRYFKANLEWTRIIAGLLLWLTEITAWKEAENELYPGIQNILKFLEGVDVVEPSELCDLIAQCQVILDLQDGQNANSQAISDNLALINQNIADIDALETSVGDNLALINQNIADIDALELDATQQALLINQNIADIDALELDATQQALLIIDLDSRVDALELASGSATLETETETIIIKREVAADIWETDLSSLTIDLTQIAFNDIDIEFNMCNTQSQLAVANLYVNGDTNANNYQRMFVGGSPTNGSNHFRIPAENANGASEPTLKIEIRGLLTNVKPMARLIMAWTDNVVSLGTQMIIVNWFYEIADSLDTLTIVPTGTQIKAFGSVKIYAYEQREVVTNVELIEEEPPVPTSWQATLDFSDAAGFGIDTHPAWFSVHDDVNYDNSALQLPSGGGGGGTGYFSIDFGAVCKVDTLVIDSYFWSGYTDDPYKAECWLHNFAEYISDAFGTPSNGNGVDMECIFTEQNTQVISFDLNSYGLINPATLQIFEITLMGVGSIPPNLAAYGEEFYD